MNVDSFFVNVAGDYPDYLRDESRFTGRADSISFPKTENELREHCALARQLKRTITIQGARTGITGGAVPQGGHILNLSKMNEFLELRYDSASNEFFITVQPGILFFDIQKALKEREFSFGSNYRLKDNNRHKEAWKEFKTGGQYFFPPDITETSASIGGMVACNASGAESFFYGPTRNYVNKLRIVLSGGDVLELRRGKEKVKDYSFYLQTDSQRIIKGDLPSYKLPKIKNASGYFIKEDMDLLDLFVGSEGTLGIISEIELRLIPLPAVQWVVIAFFPSEDMSVNFVKKVRENRYRPVAIEFFGSKGLELFRKYKSIIPAFQEMPDIASKWCSAIFLEFHGQGQEIVEAAVGDMSEIMAECGADIDAVWLGCNERDATRLKNFRHAIPEAVNMLIDERRRKIPELTKLGTDMAVADEMLDEVLMMYHKGLEDARLDYVIFGHIANNHLHVNIIPNSLKDYEQGKKLCLEWAKAIVKMGGTVSAEHGIGKLKTFLLAEMYPGQTVHKMQEVKKLFDPEGMLNPGNLFGGNI